MTVILDWLSRQVVWIALICLLGAIGYGVTALVAKRKRDTAQFTLERNVYHEQMARAWLVSGLFLALAATVFMVSLTWVPDSAASTNATPTPSSGLYTLTPEPNGPLGATETITQVVVSAPETLATPTPTPVSTAVPAELLQPDCPNPGAQLTFPVAGSSLNGVVDVLGTAQVNAFSYYRFEVIFPGAETPNFIAQYDNAVENGTLGAWDISDATRYPPGGPYRFQLVVVDIYGNTTTCTIPVNIAAQEGE